VSSAEENMALARRFTEARVKGDLDALDEMMALNFVNHDKIVPGQEPDRDDYLRGIAAFHAALSPVRLIVEDQVAGATRWLRASSYTPPTIGGSLWASRLPAGT
jgi:ketosteroid isomerase-like protein